jgi:hypothetical protein
MNDEPHAKAAGLILVDELHAALRTIAEAILHNAQQYGLAVSLPTGREKIRPRHLNDCRPDYQTPSGWGEFPARRPPEKLDALPASKFDQVRIDGEPYHSFGPAFAKRVVRGHDEITEL